MAEEDDIAFSNDLTSNKFQYGDKAELTHDQLILQAMRKCMEEGAKEMHSGNMREVKTKSGEVMQVYGDDQRQVYMQSIQALYDMMLPKFTPEMKEYANKFEEELKKIQDDIIISLKNILNSIEQGEKEGRSYSEDMKNYLISQISTRTIEPDSYQGTIYSDMILKAYRKLYQKLILCYGDKGFGTKKAIKR